MKCFHAFVLLCFHFWPKEAMCDPIVCFLWNEEMNFHHLSRYEIDSEIIKLAVNKEFFIKARRPHCEMDTVFPKNEFVVNVKCC